MKSNAFVEKVLAIKEVNRKSDVMEMKISMSKLYEIDKYFSKEQYDKCMNHINTIVFAVL